MNAPAYAPATDGALVLLALADLVESSYNPRWAFDDAYIDELAQSIKEHGVLQPLVVRPRDGAYEIVAGACRYRAARRVGLESVPAIVRALTDPEALEVAIIENLQRRDIAPLDEAHGFQQLIEAGNLTRAQATHAPH